MSKKHELVGVQYLRGIAACAVAFDHASGMAAFPKYFGKSLWDGWLTKGTMGVDLFFMISGFIIAIVSLRPGSAEAAVSVSEFARRRAVRILPMMWIAIATYAALRLAVGVVVDPWTYVRAAFVWPIGDIDPNVIWTLRHEAIFYALFAATFLSAKWLRPLIAIWFLAPIAYALSGASSTNTEPFHALVHTLCHPVNVEFGAGLLLGLVWIKWLGKLSFPIPAMLAAFYAYFIAAMAVGNVLDLRVDRIPDTPITASLFLPLLIMAVWGEARVNSFGMLLGNASFAIYLFHPHVLSALLKIWAKVAHETPIAIVVCVSALLSIAFGVAIHLLAEKPLQRWIAAKFAKKSPTLRAA